MWDEPHFFKIGTGNLLRRCVTGEEFDNILWHFKGETTAAKVLQSGFFWSTLFKDAYAYMKRCDSCLRIGNMSRRHEMPLQNVQEIKNFYYWSIDFYGTIAIVIWE